MYEQKIYDELTVNLNILVNKLDISNKKIVDTLLKSEISKYLDNNYINNLIIKNYLIKSNYPKLEIFIQFRSLESGEIKITRFDRLSKLIKINKNINASI